MSQATKIPTLPLPGQAMALGHAVTLAADGHSSKRAASFRTARMRRR